MDFAEYFPVWSKLTPDQQARLSSVVFTRSVKAGTVVHSGSLDCTGMLLIKSGQLRGYIFSDEGREVTIYRLFEMDICLLSAACIMNSLQFDITIQAEKDTELWVIPPDFYKSLMEESAPVANYTNEIMAARFSEAVWLIEQVMWKSMDKRVADFLLQETAIEGTSVLKITHEAIANHLGTHREVVTRMLRYFQSDGMVKLSRGTVEVTAPDKLRKLGVK